ncbi:DUF4382 domain-containing protein [Algoriphagus zhangzhouensis]|uniref:DUF4382 domain-containing protein n=1 Tax=Algoriphagus zhangzhouensis TaxID=1073327 RepID=A0A1M7ZBJ5_9BACT|nr:DUF4382 domain-containing protein [Algoriphagus zhangzhouensis]TDY46985.1 uncharacterized protein DUF4382 [Algoriphagus zhangzhouensis]SHO62056.1 protein of unknown function [Algoriphagus zhangzhouensis]
MKKYISYFLTALTVIFAASCTSDDSPGNLDGKARVNFYLVDAPGDFDEVWVEVLAVRVKMDDNSMDDDNSQGDDDDNYDSWQEISYEGESQMVNLLDLTGANSLLLGTEDFEEGEIDQIRLILGTNNYVVKDGVESDLKTPSAQQSGLKIKIDQELEAGQTYDLIIDFDVAKSIVVAGNSGNINLKPVLRAYLQEAAGISGQILPIEAQMIEVTAVDGDDNYTTYVDENGNFKIQGLDSGTYSLVITPNELYAPVQIDGILVVDGEMTVVDPIILDLL